MPACKDLHPTLTELMKDGLVWYDEDDREYVGSDPHGQIVNLGADEDEVERYLSAYPDPSDW